MIVKNEETTLPSCLNSVKDFVAEMIVLDTGSTDNTVKVATELGAKVYHFPWHDDFAEARNEALQYVTGDWVLVLDADEVLNPAIIPVIQKAIANENTLVINLIRQEIGSISSPYSLLSRLFRKHSQVKFSRPYHAMIDDSVEELIKRENHWQIVNLTEIAIEHYGYQLEVIISKNKTEKAKKAMERYFSLHPNDAYVSSKLGALYLQIGEEKKGIKLLKTAIKSNLADESVLFELYYHLANALNKQGDFNNAIKYYQKAIAQPILEKLKLGAYNNFASLYQAKGDFENAIKLYEITIKIEPNFALGYYNLGITYKASGRLFKAIDAYQKAIKLNPDYPYSYQNLAILLLKKGQIEDSVELFKKAINLHQKQNPPEALRLIQELQAMGLRF